MVRTRAQAYLDNHDGASSPPNLKDSEDRERTQPGEPRGTSKPAQISSQQEDITDPITCWVTKGNWPTGYTLPTPQIDLKRTLEARIEREAYKEAMSPTPTGETSGGYLSREAKCIPYQNPMYRTILEEFESFMENSEQGITPGSRLLCKFLLGATQTLPQDSLFDEVAAFSMLCERVRQRNESRLLRTITPLLVPSGEDFAVLGFSGLKCLAESVNEGWNNCIPVTRPRPQPDYSIGFDRKAFTDKQLLTLRPYIGNRAVGDRSFFMATYYMFFPFLTCEVKCGTIGLRTAEHQNAHSMTIAMRGVVYLFRQVHREQELHRRIIAFSISHDDSQVRLHGHYAEIHGQTTKYYRHTIKEFNFTNEEDRWISYRFTKTIYTDWVPQHLSRICSAIDVLPMINESSFESPAVTTPTQSPKGRWDSSSDVVPSSNDTSSSEQSEAKEKKRKRRRKQK